MTDHDDRIVKLEEELAHLRVTNEELSAETLSQWKQIEALQKTVMHLENRFSAVEDQLEEKPEDTRPPHW